MHYNCMSSFNIQGKPIPLGTGIFKTFYDPYKHNAIRTNEHLLSRKNIFEEKILSVAEKFKMQSEMANVINFNLADSIR